MRKELFRNPGGIQGCLSKLPGGAGEAAWKILHFLTGMKIKDALLAGKPQQEGGAGV